MAGALWERLLLPSRLRLGGNWRHALPGVTGLGEIAVGKFGRSGCCILPGAAGALLAAKRGVHVAQAEVLVEDGQAYVPNRVRPVMSGLDHAGKGDRGVIRRGIFDKKTINQVLRPACFRRPSLGSHLDGIVQEKQAAGAIGIRRARHRLADGGHDLVEVHCAGGVDCGGVHRLWPNLATALPLGSSISCTR